MRIEGRPYTTIERVLVQRMVEVVLGDAKAAFEPLTPVNFTLDRLETNPRFAAIARPANAAILVKLRIDMEDRGGRIELAPALRNSRANPQNAAAAVHGREVRPRQHLGKPPRHRALVHPDRSPGRAGRTEDQPETGTRPEGRRHADAERYARQPYRAARRLHSPHQGPHGPPQINPSPSGSMRRCRPQPSAPCSRLRSRREPP